MISFDRRILGYSKEYFSQKKVPFSMAIRNVELVHKYLPKHSCMGTPIMKIDKETKKNVVRSEGYRKELKKLRRLNYSLGLQKKFNSCQFALNENLNARS